MGTQKQSETDNNVRDERIRRAISVRELANSLGLGFDTVYRRVQSGEVPSIRFGRRILINAEVAERIAREGL